jgi:hypothetical protein
LALFSSSAGPTWDKAPEQCVGWALLLLALLLQVLLLLLLALPLQVLLAQRLLVHLLVRLLVLLSVSPLGPSLPTRGPQAYRTAAASHV